MQGNYKGGYSGTEILFKAWQSLAMSSLYHTKRVSLLLFSIWDPLNDPPEPHCPILLGPWHCKAGATRLLQTLSSTAKGFPHSWHRW